MSQQLLTDPAQGPVRDCLGSLARRFSHADDALSVLGSHDLGVVTGFGPTNAPTAGTLSVMLGIIELQRRLDVPVTVVISELGAWNSRNVPWSELTAVRDQMQGYLRDVGFDETRGELRSHLDPDNLVRAGKIARFLSRRDFSEHREELIELYDDQGLLGSEVGLTIDALYTVADILGPAEAGARHTLMVSGLEEAYFTELARVVLARQAGAAALSLGWGGTIGALYFQVLPGLGGFPKMSKSIPDSAVHLGMPAELLCRRICSEDPADQAPLLAAIELSSGWPERELHDARVAYDVREQDPASWRANKQRYLDTFLGFAERWARAAP